MNGIDENGIDHGERFPIDRKVVWTPQQGPQTALIEAVNIFEVFFGGARGGGKTDGMLGEWIRHCSLYGEHCAGLVVRRSFPQLTQMVERSKELFGPMGAVWYASERMWRMPNGATLRFAHFDSAADAENYQGHSYTRIYFEELTNWPDETLITKLLPTLRSAYGIPVGLRATGNPGGPGHQWVKRRYVDPAPTGGKIHRIPFTNPFTGEVTYQERLFIRADVRDNRYLPASYVPNLQASGGADLVRAWLFGDWDVIFGAYFDNWDARKHVIPPFKIPHDWNRFMAGDWGTYHPFCFGWYAVVPDTTEVCRSDGTPMLIPRDALIKYREFYGSPDHSDKGLKWTVDQAAIEILRLEGTEPRNSRGQADIKLRVLDPACFAEGGGPSFAETFSHHGLYFAEADNKRTPQFGRLGGWNQVRTRLDGIGGAPMLSFFSTCVDTIRTLPALQHDQLNPEDVDSKSEDHAADETRYACMTRHWNTKIPVPAFEPTAADVDPFGIVRMDVGLAFQMQERGIPPPRPRWWRSPPRVPRI